MAGALTFLFEPELLPKFQKFLDEVFREILEGRELALDFESVMLIFRNNMMAAILVLFGGIIFGLLPLASAAINFFILGFLFAVFAASSPQIFLLAVLPHGILEIPAFLVAAGFGFKLGMFWTKPDKSLSVAGNLFASLKQNFKLLPLLAILFFLAAVLEIFVTGNLVESLLK